MPSAMPITIQVVSFSFLISRPYVEVNNYRVAMPSFGRILPTGRRATRILPFVVEKYVTTPFVVTTVYPYTHRVCSSEAHAQDAQDVSSACGIAFGRHRQQSL
jgi:hypothetical protein